jgi:hypothetical protein
MNSPILLDPVILSKLLFVLRAHSLPINSFASGAAP